MKEVNYVIHCVREGLFLSHFQTCDILSSADRKIVLFYEISVDEIKYSGRIF